VEGKQIGVVINAETSLLSYRKDLFQRFNVKVPETMKDLEAVAKSFYGKEVDGKKMVGITLRGKGAAATSQWVDFLYSFGGSWTNAQGQSNLGFGPGHRGLQILRRPAEKLRSRGRHHAPLGGEHLDVHGRQGCHDL